MALKDDLILDVNSLFEGSYEVSSGYAIPNVKDLTFAKAGRELELAMLFIDIKDSTKIVGGFRRVTAAKMYKSFLRGISKIVRSEEGKLLSFNGDGVLAGFIGNNRCDDAVRTAMKMKWFFRNILHPKVDGYMVNNTKNKYLDFNFGIGIDVGTILVVKAGIGGDENNDLVWVGNATNYAVKLSSMATGDDNIFISSGVYKSLSRDTKFYDQFPYADMWTSQLTLDIGSIPFGMVYKTHIGWIIN